MISARLATKVELATVLGLEDLHDLVEIVLVDRHNASITIKDD